MCDLITLIFRRGVVLVEKPNTYPYLVLNAAIKKHLQNPVDYRWVSRSAHPLCSSSNPRWLPLNKVIINNTQERFISIYKIALCFKAC